MFDRLFGRRAAAATSVPKVPLGTRLYAIGDVHGCLNQLRTLHRRIEDDAASYPGGRKLIVYLGDYIDRGFDSRTVVDLLLQQPLPGFDHIHLRGNHEEALVRFLEDEQTGPGWLAYGGAPTLYSYGVRPPDLATSTADLLRARSELSEKLPQAHLDFFTALPLFHVEGDYVFVHAGLRPSVPLDRQTPQDMMWIRDDFLLSNADFGKVVVHGHSVTMLPEVKPNRIGIDTGAYATGRLTCLVLEGANRSFIST